MTLLGPCACRVRKDKGTAHKKPEQILQANIVKIAESMDLFVVGNAVGRYSGGPKCYPAVVAFVVRHS